MLDPSLAPVPAPIIHVVDGRYLADSRDIASLFGKEHYQVLRDIRALHCSGQFRANNFVSIKGKDLTGEFTSHVLMTKDGFAFLAMGFTGAKAAVFKEAYIATFNDMEARIRHQANLDDPKALRALLLGYTETLITAQKTIEAQEAQLITAAPKVEAYDALIATDGLICLTDAGRALNCGPRLFVDFLKTKWLFRKDGDLLPLAKYRETGWFAVKPKALPGRPATTDDAGVEIAPAVKARIVMQTMLTAKGLDYFRIKVPDAIRTKKAA